MKPYSLPLRPVGLPTLDAVAIYLPAVYRTWQPPEPLFFFVGVKGLTMSASSNQVQQSARRLRSLREDSLLAPVFRLAADMAQWTGSDETAAVLRGLVASGVVS